MRVAVHCALEASEMKLSSARRWEEMWRVSFVSKWCGWHMHWQQNKQVKCPLLECPHHGSKCHEIITGLAPYIWLLYFHCDPVTIPCACFVDLCYGGTGNGLFIKVSKQLLRGLIKSTLEYAWIEWNIMKGGKSKQNDIPIFMYSPPLLLKRLYIQSVMRWWMAGIQSACSGMKLSL